MTRRPVRARPPFCTVCPSLVVPALFRRPLITKVDHSALGQHAGHEAVVVLPRAGDGDALVQAHELGQHHGARQDLGVARASTRVVPLHGREDDRVRALDARPYSSGGRPASAQTAAAGLSARSEPETPCSSGCALAMPHYARAPRMPTKWMRRMVYFIRLTSQAATTFVGGLGLFACFAFSACSISAGRSIFNSISASPRRQVGLLHDTPMSTRKARVNISSTACGTATNIAAAPTAVIR